MDPLSSIATSSPSGTEAISGVQRQAPSAADANAFADLLNQAQPVARLDAQPAMPHDGLMDGVETRLDSLSRQMDVSGAGSGAGAATPGEPPLDDAPSAGADAGENPAAPKGFDDSEFRQAFGSLQKSYGFSIEAQLASNGASSSTKVFNDLLKGQ